MLPSGTPAGTLPARNRPNQEEPAMHA
ncbi:MAG: hypothetical protein RL148_234, partial [Planctomycetota bacterium]